MKEKIVVGLSGGVDSSAAAYLLKEQGYQVIGVTMKTWDGLCGARAEGSRDGVSRADTGPKAQQENVVEAMISDAVRVAQALDIPHYVIDFQKEFKEHVMDYFAEEYLQGRTPNPCVACNRHIKWASLLRAAKDLGAEKIATGHYARILQLPNGRYSVKNAAAAAKDQTYALGLLTQEQLAHTLMPVGDYTKEEIRAMAQKAGIPVAQKKDSQEICFIPDHDYAGFIAGRAGRAVPGPGNFVTTEGKVLGQHKGITHYTIGQRKGLGLALGHPVVVTAIVPERNEVVIGEEAELFGKELFCKDVNMMAVASLEGITEAVGKIRYAHKGEACRLEMLSEGRLKAVFKSPVRAITPGQAAVFYEEDHVLCAGTICAAAEL